jgi:uncharacterized protein
MESPHMLRTRPLSALLALVLLAAFCQPLVAADGKPAKILFFTKSTRFEHSVIKQTDGKPSFAEKILKDLGDKNGFELTTVKDGDVFTKENLDKYDLIMFYTSGDLLKEKSKDGSKPMTAEGKSLLIETVKNGKPFIALHNALKTFDETPEYYNDPYFAMLGGAGIGHGAQQNARNTLVDAKFPGTDGIAGDGFEFMEEWYTNRNFAPDIHVILVQETKGLNGGLYMRPPFPATWAHLYGKGRVFVTTIGHREDVWENPLYQKLLAGGIQWALGRVDADITPNLEKVTPQHAELPAKK